MLFFHKITFPKLMISQQWFFNSWLSYDLYTSIYRKAINTPQYPINVYKKNILTCNTLFLKNIPIVDKTDTLCITINLPHRYFTSPPTVITPYSSSLKPKIISYPGRTEIRISRMELLVKIQSQNKLAYWSLISKRDKFPYLEIHAHCYCGSGYID